MLNTQNRKNGLSDGFRVLEEFDKGLQDDRNTERVYFCGFSTLCMSHSIFYWLKRNLNIFNNNVAHVLCPSEMNVQKHLMKIHNGVNKFQMQLTDVKPTPECKSYAGWWLNMCMETVQIGESWSSCFYEASWIWYPLHLPLYRLLYFNYLEMLLIVF